MEQPVLRHVARGNHTDYVLGTSAHGWDGFDVVRFTAEEAISQPFRYEVTLVRSGEQGPVDLAELLDTPATLAIASQGRWRPVHGILAAAECLERSRDVILYQVTLVPHLWRARFRRHCRNFVNCSLRQIIDAVLSDVSPSSGEKGDGLALLSQQVAPPAEQQGFERFDAPAGCYRWAVGDAKRLDDEIIRSYVVQYNESDFDFVSRLLEEEGLSYVFEHGGDRSVMTLTDRPGKAPLFERDARYELRHEAAGIGADGQREVIRSFRERRALRPNKVTMRDFDWPRSHTVLEASAEATSRCTASADYFEFPGRDESVAGAPCREPARIRMQRFEAEQQLVRGAGSARTMHPGYRFTLHDAAGLREEGEHLTVSTVTEAEQLDLEALMSGASGQRDGARPATHTVRFEALDHDVVYRPAAFTGKPRIHGVQTAQVTAEELGEEQPEIHADTHGRVRLRFPWDETPDDGSPSSDWVRVSHEWAGASFGALFTPRVGQEVLVAYLQGDPDRPLVVGRVYNAQCPPPYDPKAQSTISTIKTRSSPDAAGFNELRFEDQAGSEQIFLHAQKDLQERIIHDHSSDVGRDRIVSIGRDQSSRIGSEQSTKVGADQTIQVDHCRTLSVTQDQTSTIGNDDVASIGGDSRSSVGANRSLFVVKNASTSVGGDRSVTVAGDRTLVVKGDEQRSITGKGSAKVGGQSLEVSGDRVVGVTGDNTLKVEGEVTIAAGGATIQMRDGEIVLDSGGGATITLSGDSVQLTGASIKIHSSGENDIKGIPIKLNC